MFSYIHPIITLITLIISIVLTAIILTRFGLKLKHQKIWYVLLFIMGIFVLLSSLLNYLQQWHVIYEQFQIFSLATIFSGIAAIGAITQWVFNPLIYTTIDPKCSSDLKVKEVSEGETINLELNTYNASKITAKDIYVQAFFPPQVKIISIDSPVRTHILKERNGIELTFDTNRSYNPLHPNIYQTFSVKIKIEELKGPTLIPVITMAKNMSRTKHSFILSTSSIDEEKLNQIGKNKNVPLVKTRERYFLFQKLITVFLFALGIFPWITKIILPLFE